jgi:hypothetical protein
LVSSTTPTLALSPSAFEIIAVCSSKLSSYFHITIDSLISLIPSLASGAHDKFSLIVFACLTFFALAAHVFLATKKITSNQACMRETHSHKERIECGRERVVTKELVFQHARLREYHSHTENGPFAPFSLARNVRNH